MTKAKLVPIPVTPKMKRAGAAVLAGSPERPLEKLVTKTYRAMVLAHFVDLGILGPARSDGIPVSKTRPVKVSKIDDAFEIVWPKAQKHKKRPPSRRKAGARV